jgi:preprotein translocase subunit SecY
MGLEKLDPILKFVPGIKKPSKPLSFREKLKWTAIIMSVYFLMFSTPALGVSVPAINSSLFTLVNTIFAARFGTLVTVGIGPIVLSSIVLQMLQGAGVIKMDLNDVEQKGRFQAIQKLSAIAIAFIEAVIFTNQLVVNQALIHEVNGAVSPLLFTAVAVQIALAAIVIIFLDESMVKYGITSGINLFIAGGIAFAIVSGTATVLLPAAAHAIGSGKSTGIPLAIESFAPLLFTVVVFLISIYILDMKVELPLVFSQFRGVGGRFPIPFLYVSVLPVILAVSLTASLGVWSRVVAGYCGPGVSIVRFFAYYVTQCNPSAAGTQGSSVIAGGLFYLLQPLQESPYGAGVGVDYNSYFYQIGTSTSPLYIPGSQVPILIPEWAHFVIYTIMLIVLCVIFGKFWVEMTGQSPKNMAEQLQDVGWQIPGFRRDPRIIENVLNKYLPTITVLGSITVALVAAFASLTGAIGNGMGILLTAGIMYAVYQQMEQENMIKGYPALDRLLS